MSIRLKVIGAIAVVFVLLFAALFISARQVLMQSFTRLEAEMMTRDVERADNNLRDELDTMRSTGRDYAHWDDTYRYAIDNDESYIATNFSDEIDGLESLDFDFVVITGQSNEVLFVRTRELGDDEAVNFLVEIEGYLDYVGETLPLEATNTMAYLSGFYRLGDQILLVATHYILPSMRTSTPAGTMTFGRIYNQTRIEMLAQQSRLNIQIIPIGSLATTDTTIRVAPVNEETVRGFRQLVDLNGSLIATLVIEEPRAIYAQGQQTINILALILIATGLVLSAATFLVLDRVVVERVTRLSQEVNAIEESSGRTARVTVQSDDEVTQVARSVNNMLGRLEQSHSEVTSAYAEAKEASRLKGEFLATMSHELRTPLNAIIGYSGIMREGIDGELDDAAMRMVGNIYDSSCHLLSLVNDVLDLSKIEAGHMDIVEAPYTLRGLVDAIADQYMILAKEKGLAFNHHVSDDLPNILVGDHERISQIVINLLSNALKFTANGSVTLLVSKRGSQLQFAVKDTGVGIPPHALTYIFDEFRQHNDGSGKPKGTGLGLAIVRKLAHAMNGLIQVESELGAGSTFTFTMPLQVSEENVISEPQFAA